MTARQERAEFAGLRALVTGGTRGIGEAIVRRLIAGGASVATTSRSAVPAEQQPAKLLLFLVHSRLPRVAAITEGKTFVVRFIDSDVPQKANKGARDTAAAWDAVVQAYAGHPKVRFGDVCEDDMWTMGGYITHTADFAELAIGRKGYPYVHSFNRDSDVGGTVYEASPGKSIAEELADPYDLMALLEDEAKACICTIASGEGCSAAEVEYATIMKAKGAFLVADIYNGDFIDTYGREHDWPAGMIRKNRETTDAQRDGFRKAVKAGVKIAYGTDAGVYPHGWNARQMPYMVKYGMTPMQAMPESMPRARRGMASTSPSWSTGMSWLSSASRSALRRAPSQGVGARTRPVARRTRRRWTRCTAMRGMVHAAVAWPTSATSTAPMPKAAGRSRPQPAWKRGAVRSKSSAARWAWCCTTTRVPPAQASKVTSTRVGRSRPVPMKKV